ncbi:MAG TPA: class I mannose-6-phosphate isomerase [Bryobacteraceae bacterium]|nr:class I mannose-6-phosphate isomerase [Bryobacteraceae bacterium]
MKPQRLQPSFREKVWGSTELGPWFPSDHRKIGEVWFEADPALPILVKFLFTTEKLSVQVHPPDRPGELGKTEMWYILRTDPQARLALGFREPVSRERLRQASLSGEVENLLEWYPLKPDDTFFAPAGTVHAIGAGLALCEIQENSDITYRLYDYGRPRELHIDQSLAVASLGPHPGPSKPVDLGEGVRRLAQSDYFVTESIHLAERRDYHPEADRFHLLIVVEGQGTIAGETFRLGEVWLVPAAAEPFPLIPEGRVHLLRTYLPRR